MLDWRPKGNETSLDDSVPIREEKALMWRDLMKPVQPAMHTVSL